VDEEMLHENTVAVTMSRLCVLYGTIWFIRSTNTKKKVNVVALC
jgi:hypothetical protein